MRRGHAGIGGWRNENPRHFRPRGGGTPHFRPPRGYGLLDTPRFPPAGPRPLRGPPPFGNRPNVLDIRTPDHDRSKYRHDNRQTNQFRPQDRNHHPNQRSIFPLLDRFKQSDITDHANQYQDHSYYGKPQREHINSMGDIDHRQGSQSATDPYSGHPAWSHPPDLGRQYEERQHYRKLHKHHDNSDGNKIPSLDYSGHRPPASDHYGGNPSSSMDNSNSFSRSVDDTVDIVRRRLQNRNDPQSTEDQPIDHKDEDLRIPSSSQSYQNPSEVQPVKKRSQRQKHRNVESNCDKMKSKIVHELFKMDKGRIHKLMDNPSSSTKFEYAISSLITESQNSLNKHMRSVAEKSLCSSEDFIRNDNNTIYEDTFMKQMQYILDPQDTVLLEDIKPLVMEELSKVLQLGEYDQPFQVVDELSYPQQIQEQQIYDNYNPSQPYDYNDYENNYYQEINSPAAFEDCASHSDSQRQPEFSPAQVDKSEPEPLFERRSRKSTDHSHDRSFSSEERPHSRVNIDIQSSREELPTFSTERRPSRRSLDSKHGEDKNMESEMPMPLFDSNTQFSEDDDPFAELDKQYHVAVDHTFMETYDLCSPQQTPTHNTSRNSSDNINPINKTPIKTPGSVKHEIDNRLLDMAKSPLKLISNSAEVRHKHTKSSNRSIKKETLTTPTKEDSVTCQQKAPPIKHESSTEYSNESEQKEKSENVEVSDKSLLSSSSRKRSVDQRPSHRKEKRKKSESQSDSNQQILNKNIIINVNDCATKDKEKCTESGKSIFNLFFSKNDNSKEVPKKVDAVDKGYSDKYVKRKETLKKKDSEEKKKSVSVSTSHSIVSPKDSANSTQASKTESKTKLQTIDMFIEQPRKPTHQVHKNTVLPPNTPTKVVEPIKIKLSQITQPNRKLASRLTATQAPSRPGNRKMLVKETQTFESKSTTSRFCQTENKKTVVKSVQTDPVKFERSPSKATDAFERMKEIDMEIQVLLQEKFKLYSSLESNPSCPNTLQATLGMTVLNVPLTEAPVNEITVSEEDAIVDDFTNIPVEELEQIAMESVEHRSKQSEKRTKRNRLLGDERQSSASPTVKKNNRKSKTPNISLLEQIIDDDTPLEDIISLDDLEMTPAKSKKKSSSKKKAPKKTKLTKLQIANLLIKFDIRDCYVLLERRDMSRFFKHNDKNQDPSSEKQQLPEEVEIKTEIKSEIKHENVAESTEVVEDAVVENDLQLDMMDVSEDIIIGDNCEVKSGDDKEVERTDVVISEGIILDNSQSSETTQPDCGQSEDVCKMYDYSTDENLRRDAVTVSGHADAVLAIECIESNFVAACLDGNVYYFSNDGHLLSTLRGSNFAVTCLAIVKGKYETTVYTGSLDSRIRYYDLETGLEKGPECNVLSPIQTMDRAWDTIFVGTRTGFVLQFECKNNMLIPVSTVKFSDQSILALRAMKEGPRKVLLVAARSEDVTIKDAQTGLLLRTLEGPKMTVYTLLYEDGKVYCGTSSHQIHVFDYTSGSHAGVHEGGKGAVCLRAAGGLLFAGCYDGCVYVYREGCPRPLAQLRGPGLMLLSLAVVGTKIIAGYKDRSLYIWKIPLSILQEMIL